MLPGSSSDAMPTSVHRQAGLRPDRRRVALQWQLQVSVPTCLSQEPKRGGRAGAAREVDRVVLLVEVGGRLVHHLRHSVGQY